MELARAEGFEMTQEEARSVFAAIRGQSGELPDEELGNVAGGLGTGDDYDGCYQSGEEPAFNIGDIVTYNGRVARVYMASTAESGSRCFWQFDYWIAFEDKSVEHVYESEIKLVLRQAQK